MQRRIKAGKYDRIRGVAKMKKLKKLLRKLLILYRDELLQKPYTKQISALVDCVTLIVEDLKNE